MKSFVALSTVMLAVSLPATAMAYGEGDAVPYEARAIHLLTNEARTAPHEALNGCGDNCSEGKGCFKDELPPLYWHEDLGHAAQFHANMLSEIACLQHDSPCTLKSSVAQDFPGTCGGSPSCACEEGTAACNSKGTGTFSRIGMFYKGGGSRAENIAQSVAAGKPVAMFQQWLFEKSQGKCGSVMGNGHRESILSPEYHVIGVGVSGKYGVQDFGDLNDSQVLTSGSHYQDGETLWFKTHYYSETKKIAKAALVLDGQCTALSKTRGSLNNGIFGTSEVAAPAGCTPYFYEAVDEEGTSYRFPSTGSLLYQCDKSWQSQAADSCIQGLDGHLGGGESGCTASPVRPVHLNFWVVGLFAAGIVAGIRYRLFSAKK